jgi:isoleucyl-tRNA synthetase
MPQVDDSIDTAESEEKWEKIMSLRDEVLKVLEELRQTKQINSNQEASVKITTSDEEVLRLLNEFGIDQFVALCIVSEVVIQQGEGETKVKAQKSVYPKCKRCWNYWPSVGKNADHPDLCQRCVEVVTG